MDFGWFEIARFCEFGLWILQLFGKAGAVARQLDPFPAAEPRRWKLYSFHTAVECIGRGNASSFATSQARAHLLIPARAFT